MKEKFKKVIAEILEAALIVAVLYILFFPAKVDGSSMEKTLYNGDIIFISRAMAMADFYDKDDIVVFNYRDGEKERRVVKRIAATEGDVAESIDGMLYINGEEYAGYECENEFRFELEENEFFVLGDNNLASVDSRDFGIITDEHIEARAVIKLFPFKKIKLLL